MTAVISWLSNLADRLEGCSCCCIQLRNNNMDAVMDGRTVRIEFADDRGFGDKHAGRSVDVQVTVYSQLKLSPLFVDHFVIWRLPW